MTTKQMLKNADISFNFFTMTPKVVLYAHKHILAAGSSVFHDMFYGDSDQHLEQRSTLAEPETFAIFLQSFYGIDIPINTGNIIELLQLADEYKAEICWIKCIKFLKDILCATTVCSVLDVARKCDWNVLSAIHGPCVNTIYEHFDEVIKSKGFISCHSSTLQTILSQRPNDRNEFKVVEAIVQWSMSTCSKYGIDSNRPENHRKLLGSNLHLIDFKSLSEADLMICQRDYQLLGALEMKEIINKSSD